MKLKGKTRPPATTGEPLLTLWQGGQGEDLDAVQVFEDGLLIHTSTQQRKRRYRPEFVPFASFESAKVFFGTLYLQTKGQRGVRGVATSDERTARGLLALAGAGIRAAAHSEDGDEAASLAALEDLRARAEEARKVYGEDNEVSVREITVPSYDVASRRAHIVGEIPLREGEPLRLDVAFVISELRRRYLSISDFERVMGRRPTFRAYWSLSGEGKDGEAGGFAELDYSREDDTFLVKLHNGFEDELSPTTEDYASELLREAAPVTVYIESVS
jgi:hypothetical protein